MAESFVELVRRHEKKYFPEFIESDIYTPLGEGERYFYFSPSWHVHHELVTKEMVGSLRQEEKKVLSVGAGPAHLERFLVKHFRIPKKEFTLADIETEMPLSFAQEIFDMFGSWPKLGAVFDYVLFPESVLITSLYRYDGQREAALEHLCRQSLAVLRPGGEARMNGHCLREDIVEAVRNGMAGCVIRYAPNLIVIQKL